MNRFQHRALVRASQQKIYQIITNIEDYPKIISGCLAARVSSREQCQDGSEQVSAQLTLGLGPFKRQFITNNIHIPYRLVQVQLHSGSVDSLSGEWRLIAQGEALTQVECDFDFSLGNQAINSLAAKFLKGYIRRSIDHYITCAEQH